MAVVPAARRWQVAAFAPTAVAVCLTKSTLVGEVDYYVSVWVVRLREDGRFTPAMLTRKATTRERRLLLDVMGFAGARRNARDIDSSMDASALATRRELAKHISDGSWALPGFR